MDEVRANVASILNLDGDTMKKLLDRLEELGVSSVADLIDVHLEDIVVNAEHPDAILLPNPARQLAIMWHSESGDTSDVQNVASSSTACPPPSTSVASPCPSTPRRSTSLPSSGPLTSLDTSWYQNFDREVCIRGMLTAGQLLSVQQAAKKLRAGPKLTSAQRNEVVRHIAVSVLKLYWKPQSTSLNAVAEATVNMYKQLKDDIDGFA